MGKKIGDELPFSGSAQCDTQAEKELQAPPDFSACIVGAGAIGCHLAYVLQRAGCDVTIIARGENLKALQAHGLKISICGEDVGPVRIRATDKVDEVGHVDYVFLTMKVSGYSSGVAVAMKPLIGPHTTILPPTTSIPYWWFHHFGGEKFEGCRLARADPDNKLWDLMPPGQVLGFTMWLSAVRTGPGEVVVRHIQRGYPVGELDGSSSPRVQTLAAALERGGIAAPVTTDIRSEIFIKAVNSLAFNLVAVLGDATNGQIADVAGAVETLHSVMTECEVIANRLSIPIRQSAESRIKQTLAARMHTMSMLHDFRSGRKMELGPLWASFQDVSDLIGVNLPVTRALVGVAMLREAAERERQESSV